jgi:predicted esterase
MILPMALSSRSVIIQPLPVHTHAVIFLHGRGDTASNFSSSLKYSTDSQGRTLDVIFPSFRWVFPQAAIGPSLGFRDPRVSQWFDIWDARNFSDREDLQAEGLRESVNKIRQIIRDEAAALGGRWDRIILAGISQGAATCVHTLLNLSLTGPPSDGSTQAPRGLCAFLGFSCRMPFPGRTVSQTREILGLDDVPDHTDVLQSTPMLLEHCANDEVVQIQDGRVLRDTLREFGADVSWKEYPDGGHWFNSPTGIDDAAEFLRRAIAAADSTQPRLSAGSDAMDVF